MPMISKLLVKNEGYLRRCV